MGQLFNVDVDLMRQKVLARILQGSNCREDAEDAVDEAILRFASSDVTAYDESHLIAWLTVVARHCLTDAARHTRVLPCIPLEDCIRLPQASDVAEAVTFQLAVRQAWRELAEQDRLVLEMKNQGRTCDEIAIALRLNRDTAKKRLQRAQLRFQKPCRENGLDEISDIGP
jgi:RNA polymerase sigma factor (sigma-70 family)